jgi:hypothetical protein
VVAILSGSEHRWLILDLAKLVASYLPEAVLFGLWHASDTNRSTLLGCARPVTRKALPCLPPARLLPHSEANFDIGDLRDVRSVVDPRRRTAYVVRMEECMCCGGQVHHKCLLTEIDLRTGRCSQRPHPGCYSPTTRVPGGPLCFFSIALLRDSIWVVGANGAIASNCIAARYDLSRQMWAAELHSETIADCQKAPRTKFNTVTGLTIVGGQTSIAISPTDMIVCGGSREPICCQRVSPVSECSLLSELELEGRRMLVVTRSLPPTVMRRIHGAIALLPDSFAVAVAEGYCCFPGGTTWSERVECLSLKPLRASSSTSTPNVWKWRECPPLPRILDPNAQVFIGIGDTLIAGIQDNDTTVRVWYRLRVCGYCLHDSAGCLSNGVHDDSFTAWQPLTCFDPPEFSDKHQRSAFFLFSEPCF